MKYILLVFALLFSLSASADEYVRGYQRNDGTYVQPYHRSSPDGNPYNNYSTQGNINPYTGQQGHVNPYEQQQRQQYQQQYQQPSQLYQQNPSWNR